MIQDKPCSPMAKVAWIVLHFERRGRMKKPFSFIAKFLGLFSRISDISWIIIILLLIFAIIILLT